MKDYRILIALFEDNLEKDAVGVVHETNSFREAQEKLKSLYDDMKSKYPNDDRWGFTLMQAVTFNGFGKVTKKYVTLGTAGPNPKYLINEEFKWPK